jgi:gentisate 1,2-dioxygenase
MALNEPLSQATRKVLDRNDLSPLWEIEETKLGEERKDLEPGLWKWADIKSAIDHIAEDVTIDELPPGFRRRVAVPVNSNYASALSHTIYLGIQTVSPGETAPSHRHGANAMRFTIEGNEEVKTTVGGEEFAMLDNDLVTTPQWEWHDHVNESDEEIAWLDVLDLPLMFNSLNAGNVFEDHQETRQEVDKPNGYYASQFGKLRNSTDESIPGPFDGFREPTPPFRFEWEDCYQSLMNAARHNENTRSPYDGVVLDYVNPATGKYPLFPSFGVRAQLLDGTLETHRHNATEVYYVINGSGNTEVSGTDLAWEERDIFVVPSNNPHNHQPDDEAILLSITDKPIFDALNFYHEVAL